jgi:hypothetical protein
MTDRQRQEVFRVAQYYDYNVYANLFRPNDSSLRMRAAHLERKNESVHYEYPRDRWRRIRRSQSVS